MNNINNNLKKFKNIKNFNNLIKIYKKFILKKVFLIPFISLST